MKKSNKLLSAIILSLVFAALSYYLTEDFIICAVVLIVSALLFNAYSLNVLTSVKEHQSKIAVAHQIIHSIAVDISTKKNLHFSLEGLQEHLPEKYQKLLIMHEGDYLQGLQEIAEELQIVQFHVFCKLLRLYEQQGNITSMNYMILGNIDNLKVKTDKLIREKKGRTREIVLMWGMTLGIILYMRFGLAQFYKTSLNSIYFRYAVGGVLIMVAGGISLLLKNMKSINLERGEMK